MRASPLQGFLEHLRQRIDPARQREPSDADLLERFRRQREEAAFTLLMQRHGPMVLAVCRRVLGDAHEAEDAFQATFLVLVHQAGAIRKQQSLAGWLHSVAARIARKAGMRVARQRIAERQIQPPTVGDDPCDTLAVAELRAVLDEEIERLPAKYRMPLVLCYVADKTHEQAAHELGWPKSSLTTRLAKARDLLQRRLRRRGFTAPAGLLAVMLTEATANAAVPALLTLSTVRLAAQALAGETLAATATTALANSFVKGATLTKWIASLTLLATLGFAATLGYRMANTGSPAKQAEPAAKATDSPRATQAEPRKPRLDLQGDPLPDGVLARMGSGRLRHGGFVRQLAFTPDGKSLVSGGGRGLRIWDAATGKLRRRADAPGDWTLSFAFTRDGILVASADNPEGIVILQVINPASGKVRRRLEMPDRATSATVTLSRDGKWLAYSHQNNIRLYDTASGKEKLRLPRGESMVFAPDGKSLAVCDSSNTVRLHDTANGECTRRLQHQGDHVAEIAISADGRYLASIPHNDGQELGEISIWDLRTDKERHRLKGAGGSVLSAAFSPDDKYVAVGCRDSHLLLFDLATGKEVRRFPTDALFAGIAFSPDGKSLAAVSGEGVIRLWETETGRVLPASADPFLDAVHELHFSADGRRLLGHAGIYFAWDANTGRELRRFPKASERYWPAALAPDESLLVTADPDGTLRLWDAKTGREVRALKGHDKSIWSMVFSQDGHRLFSSCAEDRTIRVWDVAGGREIRKLTCPNRMARLAVSPDGRWLASASDERGSHGYEVLLWDLTTGREKTRFLMAQNNSAHQLAFSPNSRLLAAVGGGLRKHDPGEVQVWDVTGERQRRWFEGHKSRVRSVAFSPDNRMLTTGDMNGELFLWELASGRRRHRFVGHETWINALAFSPGGRLLAASSFDAPVFIWDVMGITAPPHRPLSEAERQRAWTALGSEDAIAAFEAIRRLAAAPKQTLPFIRERLKPVPAPDPKHVRQWVEMLDSDDFATRQRAAEELEKQADAATSLLRQILDKEKPSLEVRRRLQQILQGIDSKLEALRAVRAVEVLEWIGTADAVRLLEELAKGAEEARLTREAIAAKRRLSR
jgi:RNA polymerase sigma factor (sigma-70 family)